MAFKVKCRLVGFMGDEERFPCHFGYKVGDEFIYDGEKFIGRVCPGVLSSMMPIILANYNAGLRYGERVLFKYAGLSKRDPSMKRYDGIGWAPVKELPEGVDPKRRPDLSPLPPTERHGGGTFVCGDSRTAAKFVVQPFALAENGWDVPYYRREMSILEKIKAEPGMSAEEMLSRFTKWEREDIYPPLTPLMLELMLDEMAQVNLIEIRDGRAYEIDL